MLATLSPTDQAIALEYVGDGFLLAMMMDAGTGSGLNEEYPAPKLGCDTIVSRDRSTTLGPWRLRRSSIELGGRTMRMGEYSLIRKPSSAKRLVFRE